MWRSRHTARHLVSACCSTTCCVPMPRAPVGLLQVGDEEAHAGVAQQQAAAAVHSILDQQVVARNVCGEVRGVQTKLLSGRAAW